MRVVVVGDVMVDVVTSLPGPLAYGSDTPAPIDIQPGGSGANVAAWLGPSAVLAARIGADALGEAAVAGLDAGAIERDPERPTGTCIVLVHPGGERTMIPDPGANDALQLETLPAGEHLHVTGYGLLRDGSRPAVLRALETARKRGMTISVDPSSAAPLRGVPSFREWVDGAGLLLPNADEACVLSGEQEPERAALALARGGREVVVTLGASGALWTDGDEVVRVPAVAAEVVDTTGAGDAFAAGLLSARLGGAGPREALEAGCRTAAAAVARVGARP